MSRVPCGRQRRPCDLCCAPGFHPDFHQPGDDVDKIDFAAFTRCGQLIFRTTWAVAAARGSTAARSCR
jgi:hypothetical protein